MTGSIYLVFHFFFLLSCFICFFAFFRIILLFSLSRFPPEKVGGCDRLSPLRRLVCWLLCIGLHKIERRRPLLF